MSILLYTFQATTETHVVPSKREVVPSSCHEDLRTDNRAKEPAFHMVGPWYMHRYDHSVSQSPFVRDRGSLVTRPVYEASRR